MKVALAFFGQPRGLDNNNLMNQWRNIIDQSEHEIDVYAHFWDRVSNLRVSDRYEEFVEETEIDTETHFINFWNEIKPVNIEVQSPQAVDQHSYEYFFHNEYIYRRVDPTNVSTGRATLGQWYSTEKVLRQVTKSDKEYDVVVRIRPDILFLDIKKDSMCTDPLDNNIINNFYNRKVSNRCIGSPKIKVIKGIPIVNDWWTVMEGNFVEEFNYKLTQNIAMQFNAMFTEPDDPITVQENALHRHCMKLRIDAISTLCNTKIYRETDDDWKWPNYSH